MKELHHANIILGGKDSLNSVYKILEEDLGLKLSGNPDFLLIESDTFGIEEARRLQKWAYLKPLLGEVKASLVIADTLGWEAQNALLKIFEEPSLGTYFFIKIESLAHILPTFLSRVRVLDERKSEEASDQKKAKEFIKSDIKVRFSIIRNLAKNEDKSLMKDLIGYLEEVAYHENMEPVKMKKILKAKVFASQRGSSPKMILEWLACMV